LITLAELEWLYSHCKLVNLSDIILYSHCKLVNLSDIMSDKLTSYIVFNV